jgi:hypothetical protein
MGQSTPMTAPRLVGSGKGCGKPRGPTCSALMRWHVLGHVAPLGQPICFTLPALIEQAAANQECASSGSSGLWGQWLPVPIDHATHGCGSALEDGCEQLVREYCLFPHRHEVWSKEMPLGLGLVGWDGVLTREQLHSSPAERREGPKILHRLPALSAW